MEERDRMKELRTNNRGRRGKRRRERMEIKN